MADYLSYWEKQNFYSADVIIVGSGIVGLNTALTIKLAMPKTNVLVLERGFLPSGASTKNAGFACFGSVSELIEQEKICGTDGLHQLISKRWKGLLKLRKLLGDSAICYENYGGYELFKPTEDRLSQECVLKLSHFNALIEDVVNEKEVYSIVNPQIEQFGFKGISLLLKNKLEAQIDPGLMIKVLLAKASALGVTILNNCEVKKINENANEMVLETEKGNFSCKKVVLTTNAFINELLPTYNVVPGRGQVLITKPIVNLKLKGTFHYDKGYYYFRNVENRVLLGGGRNLDFKAEETTEFGETEKVQLALLNLLNETILPNTPFEIDHKWSGIMAFGDALHPIVEEVRPNVFCAVRCNGMGIAIGSHTGQEVGELVIKSLI
ncbi:FAD-dependent oxidoreductase [Pedobacter sp. Du54]|uniref:NAD(P)/FAD-dependent oxidoreductase n=1 Tax=Pedobacter anseongensis TaxID=3133439 RepID=UPI0030A9E9CB